MRRLLPLGLCLLALVAAPAASAQDPTATTGVPPATAPPAQTTTQAAAPAATADDDSGAAPLLVGVAVLLALAALAVLLWGIARLTAWEPSWLPASRHSIGEAGYRTANTWAEFRDWLRPRRRR